MRRDSDYLGANPPSTWDWASTKADGRDIGHPSLSLSIYLFPNFHTNLQYLILIIFLIFHITFFTLWVENYQKIFKSHLGQYNTILNITYKVEKLHLR